MLQSNKNVVFEVLRPGVGQKNCVFEVHAFRCRSPAPPSSMLDMWCTTNAMQKTLFFFPGPNLPGETINIEEGGAGERAPNGVHVKTLFIFPTPD